MNSVFRRFLRHITSHALIIYLLKDVALIGNLPQDPFLFILKSEFLSNVAPCPRYAANG